MKIYGREDWQELLVTGWNERGFGFAETADGENIFLHQADFRRFEIHSTELGAITYWPGKKGVKLPWTGDIIYAWISDCPKPGKEYRMALEWTCEDEFLRCQSLYDRMVETERKKQEAEQAEKDRLEAARVKAEKDRKKCLRAVVNFLPGAISSYSADVLKSIHIEPDREEVPRSRSRERKNSFFGISDTLDPEIWNRIHTAPTGSSEHPRTNREKKRQHLAQVAQ